MLINRKSLRSNCVPKGITKNGRDQVINQPTSRSHSNQEIGQLPPCLREFNPHIVMSEELTAELATRASQMGAKGVMEKPLDADRVERQIGFARDTPKIRHRLNITKTSYAAGLDRKTFRELWKKAGLPPLNGKDDQSDQP
jgi:hypothetical protein